MIIDFNTPEKPVIIGLDHGYGNMKTAHTCFQTGVTRHDREPTFKSNLLFYDGQYYTIGEEHKEFTADKMTDQDYFILTLAGIASELAFYGRQAADVHLGVGLPLTWVAEQKDDFKKYLMQRDPRDEIVFTFKTREYRIRITGVDVFPQGFAAIVSHLSDFKGVNMLCDIGTEGCKPLGLQVRFADCLGRICHSTEAPTLERHDDHQRTAYFQQMLYGKVRHPSMHPADPGTPDAEVPRHH